MDLLTINYFVLYPTASKDVIKISNYFYKYPYLPLDRWVPYPLKTKHSYVEWLKLYRGVTDNPMLSSIQTNSSSVLISLLINNKYIINPYYASIWLELLSNYFSLESSFILLSNTVDSKSALPLLSSSLDVHVNR